MPYQLPHETVCNNPRCIPYNIKDIPVRCKVLAQRRKID